LSAPFFYTEFKKRMIEEDKEKPEIPRRMSRLAFPKAKFGVYLAVIIILIILLILYKDAIL